MRNYRQNAEKRQAQFRAISPTISPESRAPSDARGQLTNYLLALEHETDNLYWMLLGNDGAISFFEKRGIKWWKGYVSGDDTSTAGPTRSMMSSQVACVNFLLPLVYIEGALTTVLRSIDSDVRQVVTIEHQGNTSPVEFEWIGLHRPLERVRGRKRGYKMTSVDALIVADTDSGLRAYFMEWKYAELYSLGKYKGGTRHYTTYSDLYTAESSSFNGVAPMDELLYEPFYQLMRQRLLADRMVNNRELGVSDAKVIAVVPADNTVYRERITSPGLAQRFSSLKTVSDVFRATLKHPDVAYAMVCPSVLVDAVAREHGGAAADWIVYQRERYGL